MLHDPYANATPSQRLAWAHRSKLRAEIAAKARPDIPIALRKPTEIEFIPVYQTPPPPPAETWEERQKKIPIFKESWFSIVEEVAPPQPTIEQIQRTICLHYNISRNDLLSIRRFARIVKPRQIGMYLCKTLTSSSLPAIGRRFGGRDHTTVLHAFRKIERLIGLDLKLKEEIETIRAEICP